jgi:hypothetical protein
MNRIWIVKISLVAVFLTTLFVECVKTTNKEYVSTKQSLVAQAQSFFDKEISPQGRHPNSKNYRAGQSKSIDWDHATVLHLSTGTAVLVPVTYRNKLFVSSSRSPNIIYSLSDLTFLVIDRDSQSLYRASVITFIPDTPSGNNSLSGLVLTEDWQGNSLATPYQLSPNTPSSARNPPANNQKQIDIVQNIQVCNEIDGYNYSPDDPEGGITTWSESSCNTYSLIPMNTGPTLGPGSLAGIVGPKPIALTVKLSPPSNPIGNITDYFKCFTNGTSPDHTYSVQVCVDQPSPGTRQPWTLTPGGATGTSAAANPLNVGHTFLVLTENDQGNTITRNVGFYPSTTVFPVAGYTSAQGVLNDDDGHPYNISLTIAVSATQFFGILNYVSLGNNPGFSFDLNSNNCTTFVINSLGANGIALPNTKGTWATGSGNDPGDLGEDIIQMQLGTNMTRNTVSNPHPNVGTCN